jgi:hypothetical protein
MVAVIEALIALALIFGFARRLTYTPSRRLPRVPKRHPQPARHCKPPIGRLPVPRPRELSVNPSHIRTEKSN